MGKDLLIILLMVVVEIGLGAYGLFNGFNSFIGLSMALVAVACIVLAYYLNHKDSIYSGKFKDHFKD